MPKFVKVCKNDFTTFHNAMWRDSTLDFTERGLLGTMLTLPDNWNFSIKGLAALCPSGERRIGTSLKKIEKAGYLKREPIRNNGRIIDWKYSFSDEPIFREESKPSDDENGRRNGDITVSEEADTVETSSKLADENPDNVENYVENNVENFSETPHCQNSNVAKSDVNESPDCCFADVDGADVKKSIAYQIPNNQILSNQNLSYQRKTKVEKGDVENFSDVIDEMDFEEAVEEVKEQLSADNLYYNNHEQTGLIDEIIELIATVYTTKQLSVRIGGDHLDIEFVRKRFCMLNDAHIEYILDCINGSLSAIKNRRNYLLTCLYKAPMTIDGYYANQVRHDMARGVT